MQPGGDLLRPRQNFWMLLIGRGGIGLGEGGFTSPSQSWIADLFPVRQRATAPSVFLLGASLGNLIGPALGGWAGHAYGWRNAMQLASIPVLILVPIVWFTLRDYRPGLADGVPAPTVEGPSFMETVRLLLRIRTLPPLILAAALNALLTICLISWAPAFMARAHGMSAQTAGLQMGGALFLGSVLAIALGGPLADFLGRRDLRCYVWMLMIGGALSATIDWFTLTGPSARVFPLFGISMLMAGCLRHR